MNWVIPALEIRREVVPERAGGEYLAAHSFSGGDIESFLRFPTVLAKLVAVARRSTFKISHGELPAPVKLGVRAVGWPETAIAHWIAARIDATPPTD